MPKCFGESKFVTLVEISLLLLNHLLVEVSPCGASGSSSKAYMPLVGKLVGFWEPYFLCTISPIPSQGGYLAGNELMRFSLPEMWD